MMFIFNLKEVGRTTGYKGQREYLGLEFGIHEQPPSWEGEDCLIQNTAITRLKIFSSGGTQLTKDTIFVRGRDHCYDLQVSRYFFNTYQEKSDYARQFLALLDDRMLLDSIEGTIDSEMGATFSYKIDPTKPCIGGKKFIKKKKVKEVEMMCSDSIISSFTPMPMTMPDMSNMRGLDVKG